MNRNQKAALLTKLITGTADQETIRQAQRLKGAGFVVIIQQPGDLLPGPDDIVSFYFQEQQVTIPYKDIGTFTRYDPLTILFMPDNGRGI